MREADGKTRLELAKHVNALNKVLGIDAQVLTGDARFDALAAREKAR